MIRAAQHLLTAYGLSGAGLILMLEGLGFPIPVEIPLWIIGLRQARGEASFWAMVLLMWLSTVVGNTLGYVIGYYGGRPAVLKVASWVRIKPEHLDRVEAWFQKHGLKVVVATRWFNWGFAQNMWLCGITRVPLRRFFPVMILNDLLWAVAWTWVARSAVVAFRRHGFRFLHLSTLQVGLGALALVAVGLTVWLVARWWRGRRRAQKLDSP